MYANVKTLAVCLFLTYTSIAGACTAFCLQDNQTAILAKNHDYHLDEGFIIVNKRGIAKRALLLSPTDIPALWTSKYGSVTFNQYGRELSESGINEAGLAIVTLWLSESRYPEPDQRPAIMTWVQYHLDNHATVPEIVASDKKIRMASETLMPIHFMACDRAGRVGVFEYLKGRLVYHTDSSLPIKALANDTYERSLVALKDYEGFGGAWAIPWHDIDSRDRFVCAARRVKQFPSLEGPDPVAYAFASLERLRQGRDTKHMIVYDTKNLAIHYRTLRKPQTKTIHLKDCDFDSQTEVQGIAINNSHRGTLNPFFQDYTRNLNRQMIKTNFGRTESLRDVPSWALEILIRYPEFPQENYLETALALLKQQAQSSSPIPSDRFPVYLTALYLTDWQVAGPFTQKAKTSLDLFDIPLGPERGELDIGWRPMEVEPSELHPVYLNLHRKLFGGDQRVAYLRTEIQSDREKTTFLEIFSDDGVKVWLNDQLVHTNNLNRGIQPNPDVVEVTLKQGVNHLLLKVTQDTGPWGAVVRWRASDKPEVEEFIAHREESIDTPSIR